MKTDLENLCRPLLLRICEYWQLRRNKAELDLASVSGDLNHLLDGIRTQCDDDSLLAREFSRIERPLVFFIDYTIKEGNFPFRSEWREMARNYNELSGDEKFFDLLTETLDDPDSTVRLKLFFLMMGLGFDGVYKNDPAFIERKMKICAARGIPIYNISREPLTPQPNDTQMLPLPKKNFFRTFQFVLVILSVIALISWIVNLIVFTRYTEQYRTSITYAVHQSTPLPSERIPASLQSQQSGKNTVSGKEETSSSAQSRDAEKEVK